MKKLITILFIFLFLTFLVTPTIVRAGSMSDYLENEVLDHVFKTGNYTVPTNLYIALYTTCPTDSTSGTEVSGGSYTRVIANTWDVAASGATENTNTITFATPSADWGTVVCYSVMDASTSGNMLWWGALTLSRIVNDGSPAPAFAVGEIDVTLD